MKCIKRIRTADANLIACSKSDLATFNDGSLIELLKSLKLLSIGFLLAQDFKKTLSSVFVSNLSFDKTLVGSHVTIVMY